jgi:2-dehydro-3-deoxygluconokinase
MTANVPSPLDIRPAADIAWDCVALGEVMLRLDPGEERISTARTFRAWEGGGEYNVARGLSQEFGHRTAIVTALVDNPVGRFIEGLMRTGGVDLECLSWLEFDGIGRSARNGRPKGAVPYEARGSVVRRAPCQDVRPAVRRDVGGCRLP